MPSDLIRGWIPVRAGRARQSKAMEPRFGNSERGGYQPAVSAAGSDDQGRRIARRKGLRSHEDPVIGGAGLREIDHGLFACGVIR
jgi:hypothetical protein